MFQSISILQTHRGNCCRPVCTPVCTHGILSNTPRTGKFEKIARAATNPSLNVQPYARSTKLWSLMLLRHSDRILFRRKGHAHLTPATIGLSIVHRKNIPVKAEWPEKTAMIIYDSILHVVRKVEHKYLNSLILGGSQGSLVQLSPADKDTHNYR